MYEVIHFFTDLQDFNHPYNVGDEYPRQGMKVSEARIKELSGKANKQEKPLIKEVGDVGSESDTADGSITYTKTQIARMSKAELVELAEAHGIGDADEYNGSKLKEILVDKLGL